MADEEFAEPRVFLEETGFVVEIETATRVLSFCLSDRQRNALVFDLLNPRKRPTPPSEEHR